VRYEVFGMMESVGKARENGGKLGEGGDLPEKEKLE
jgi:hypothetical protein